jgi:hypothetical protein
MYVYKMLSEDEKRMKVAQNPVQWRDFVLAQFTFIIMMMKVKKTMTRK